MSSPATVAGTTTVRPRSAAEVVEIVAGARAKGTPLVPVSSGPPHFKGSAVPVREGSVVVDLSDMRRIVRVDRTNRVAMCEPGVTFAELIAAVAAEGLRLNTPLMPRGSKSVVASLLDRDPVIMPKYQWDIGDPLACVEVVFGTGDVFRTGSAAGPGSVAEQWQAGGAQKEAAGPSAASWYRLIQGAQGTMGIVTWASVRCELLPRLESPFLVGASQPSGLVAVMRWLVRRRLANECFVLSRSAVATAAASRGLGSLGSLEAGLPEWVLVFNVAGYDYLPEARVEGQAADAAAVVAEYGLSPVKTLGELEAAELLEVVRRPSADPYWKLTRKGAFRDTFFLTTNERLEELLRLMRGLVQRHGFSDSELGVYLQPIVQGTGCHVEYTLFYDPDSPGETAAVEAISGEATRTLMGGGAFFSRPYGPAAATVLRKIRQRRRP